MIIEIDDQFARMWFALHPDTVMTPDLICRMMDGDATNGMKYEVGALIHRQLIDQRRRKRIEAKAAARPASGR